MCDICTGARQKGSGNMTSSAEIQTELITSVQTDHYGVLYNRSMQCPSLAPLVYLFPTI